MHNGKLFHSGYSPKIFFSVARPEVEKRIKQADARGGLLGGWKTKLAQDQKTMIAGTFLYL